jgi:hypothetical protein
VTRLALFGSIARNTATIKSDVDVLVAFDGPATSKRYFGVQFYLEDLLGFARSTWSLKKPYDQNSAPTSNKNKLMSDAGKREWRFYLDDMIEFAERVLRYTDGFERAGFVMSGLTYHNHRQHQAPSFTLPPSFRA